MRLFCFLPCDIKNGIRNFPDTTILRRSCNVAPSNGKAPQTKTYKTTPKLHISARGPSYSRPKKTYKISKTNYVINPMDFLLFFIILLDTLESMIAQEVTYEA